MKIQFFFSNAIPSLRQTACNGFAGRLRMKPLTQILFLALCLLAAAVPPQAAVRYVKPVASGSGDGSSWGNASGNLQGMINASAPGDQVWVAAGIYKPTTGSDRTISFVMKNGVAIYGGFNGSETLLSQRNWVSNATILTGDLNGDDVVSGSGINLQITNRSENSFHVINNVFTSGSPLTASAILDGFTITGGHGNQFGDYNGAGMYNIYASPTLSNLRFEGNWSVGAGGGMYNTLGASPALYNVTFSRNVAQGTGFGGGGAGMFNWPGSSPVLNNVHFTGNLSYGNLGGGGVVNYQVSPAFNSCSFTGNFAFSGGGGASNIESNAVFTNCVFAANGANFYGGAVFNQFGTPAFTNCTVYGNTALYVGAITNNSGAVPILRNCIIWGNTGNISKTVDGSATVTYSILEGSLYPGTGNANLPPSFLNPGNPIGADGLWGTADDGLRLQPCSPGLNQGDNTNLPGTDFAGSQRIFNNTVDMGAYELQSVSNVPLAYYQDNDADGYGSGAPLYNCQSPGAGYVLLDGDCNDNNAAINPTTVWYQDADNDGYSTGSTLTQCAQPAGYKLAANLTATSGDCNDGNAAINPATIWYQDADNDGYSTGSTLTQCAQPAGYKLAANLTATSGDCNDGNAAINPATIWYQDADNDGYSTGSTLTQCTQPAGYKLAANLTATSGDCNDGNAAINPGAIDNVCNGIDEDCSGTAAQDNIPPTALCKNITVALAGASAAITAAQIDNGSSDNCSAVTLSTAPTSFSCTNLGPNIVTLTVADEKNNTASCNATVTIIDNEPPVLVCPENITVNTGPAACGAVVSFDSPTVSDNCPESQNLLANPYGNSPVTSGWTILATEGTGDGFGQLPGSGFAATFFDCTRQNLINRKAQTIDLLSLGYTPAFLDASPDILISETFRTAVLNTYGNCSGYTPPSFLDKYYLKVELRDASNAVIASVNFGTAASPLLAPEAGITHSHTFSGYPAGVRYIYFEDGGGDLGFWGGFFGTYMTNAWVSIPPTISQTGGLASGSTFPRGTTVNSFVASNGTSCQFTVTVQDNEAPTISCPATQTLALGPSCSASLPDYTSLASTGDNCGVQGVTQSPPVGTTVFGAGNTSVTLTVTDVNGNSNSCQFTASKADTTAPTISCPATQTLALSEDCTAALPDYTSLASAGDNCGVQGVTQSPPVGTTVFGAGNTTVTLTVTDVNGNSNSCQFTVSKADTTAPTISCPTTQTLALGPSCSAALPGYTSLASAGDNCGVQGVTQSPPVGTTVFGAGNTTVTLTVTDVNGNSNSCQFTVNKVDNTAPTISCPATQTLALGEDCTAALPDYTSLASTGDNCGVQGVTQFPAAQAQVSGPGNVVVSLVATDGNGNSSNCTFMVSVADQTAPVAVCQNTTVYLGANGEYALQESDVLDFANSSDNCSFSVSLISPAVVDCGDFGTTVPVLVSITDPGNNFASCLANVYVDKSYALPAPWAGKDIGNAGAGNSYAHDPCQAPPAFTITANANNSTLSADNLALISQALCGDFQMTVRVQSVTPTGYAGLTARESSAPGSKMVGIYSNLNNLLRWEARTATNANKFINFFSRPLPYWLRLQRQGNWFYGYYSSNGVIFTLVTAQQAPMGSCLEVGMGAFTNIPGTPATAVFSNVSVSGGVLPLVQLPPAEELAAGIGRSISLYPNPAQDVVTVEMGVSLDPGLKSGDRGLTALRLRNELGQLLETRQIGAFTERFVWDISSGLVPGLYFIEVTEEGKAPQVLKFVKQE